MESLRYLLLLLFLSTPSTKTDNVYIKSLHDVKLSDLNLVGGKKCFTRPNDQRTQLTGH